MTHHLRDIDITFGNPIKRFMERRKIFFGLGANNSIGLQLFHEEVKVAKRHWVAGIWQTKEHHMASRFSDI